MIEQTFKSTRAIGGTGTSIVGGVYSEEYLSTLQGYEAHLIYNKMRRSDAKVRELLSAVNNQIKAAVWDIDPVSEDEADLKVAALMKHILFKDLDFDRLLGEILTFVPHGFSCFEPIHMNMVSKEFGQYTGLAQLAFRNQTTLTKWYHDEVTGKLKEVEQKVTGDVQVDTVIPADNLLFFYNEKEGDDNGFSFLRPLYGPYKRKLLCQELKIIGIERFAIPSPLVKVPAKIKPTDKEYLQAKDILNDFTSAQSSYIMYPEGWEINLHSNTFDPEKVQTAIKAENEEMSAAFTAAFLELGTGGNGGAYALGKDLSDFFLAGLMAIAKSVTGPINRELIPNLVRHNFGDNVGVYPELKFSNIDDKAGKELMEIVTGYTASGVITNDEKLEDHIRKAHNLPKKQAGEMIENQAVEDDVDNVEAASIDNEEANDVTDGDRNGSSDANDANNDSANGISLHSGDAGLKFKEPKTPRGLIEQETDVVKQAMTDNLRFIGEKLIADIMKQYKALPENQKVKAPTKVKLGGQAKYKRLLKGLLNTVSVKALEQVKKEIPSKKDVKLSDHIDEAKKIYESIKLADFSKLPAHVRARLNQQTELIVDDQVKDLRNQVEFTFMTSQNATDSAMVIEKDLADKMEREINKTSTAAANAVATMVNVTRNAFFFEDEVLNEIESFTFENPSPKVPICVKLAGKTFAKNDPIVQLYQTPLHHNCKSTWRANLKTTKNLPEISKDFTIEPEEKNSVGF